MGWVIGIGGLLLIAFLFLVPGMINRASDRRIARRLAEERAVREAAEAEKIAALPKLDTSHMLLYVMPEKDDIGGTAKRHGGTFGSRYVHMQVVDRDGKLYFCFMTEHNVRALWSSGFIHTRMEPTLTERLPSFEIDEVEIRAFPSMLGIYPHDHPVWHRWSELHREADQQGGRHFEYYKKYFDYGVRRDQPVDLKNAS
jgi:hypothetical protein